MMHTTFPRLLLTACLLWTATLTAKADEAHKLTGDVIGTAVSVDYSNGSASTTVNTVWNAFDGDMGTYFASYDRSKTWAGLDLGTPHVIRRVGWSPRNDGLGPGRVVLALFEGANQPDFRDAVPLYLVDAEGTIGQMSYADVTVSRGFRYVRYVGPADARCNIAELEFWGYEGEGDDSRFYQLTNLPTLSIHTEGNVDPYDKVNDIVSNITLIYEHGSRIQEEACSTRLRGNASINFPKKPYRIKLDEKKHMFKGDTISMRSPAKAKKWTLVNNYGDKSLMRNIVSFEVARRMGMTYVPWCQPVDVLVNGEYKGCYQLCDQITVGKNRVDITEMDSTDNEGEALTGGYLLELDGYASAEPSWFNSMLGNPVTIKSPSDDDITPEQRRYIENFYNSMEGRMLSRGFADPVTGYRSMFDATSLLTYLLTEEIVGNPDAFHSCYMYKDRGEDRLHVGPVWDFDLAFDNDYRFTPFNGQGDFLSLARGGAGNSRALLKHLFTDVSFTDEMKEMWLEARLERGIDEESLLQYIDSTAQVLQQSQRLNFLRWPILWDRVHENPVALGSYEAEVERLREFTRTRLPWLDDMVQSKNANEPDDSEQEYMEIATAGDLKRFADLVNGGQGSLCARLVADVDFSAYPTTMIGDGVHYTGTFDGDGHTITIALRRKQDDAGLFRYLDGCVHDLTTRGSVSTSAKFAGGICAQMFGGQLLRCQSYVQIVSSVWGDGTHGGLAGLISDASGFSEIESCLFGGKMDGANTNSCGGLVGWASVPVIISNSLMMGTFSVSGDNSDILCRNNSLLLSANNYYLTDWNPAYYPGNGCLPTNRSDMADGTLLAQLNGSAEEGMGNWSQAVPGQAYPLPTKPVEPVVDLIADVVAGGRTQAYDLYGRRVSAARTGKGIYIVNGKKYVR